MKQGVSAGVTENIGSISSQSGNNIKYIFYYFIQVTFDVFPGARCLPILASILFIIYYCFERIDSRYRVLI